MKLNKILLTASLLLAGVCANAQETVTEYVFKPHWYGQLQFGFQETVGEGKFGKLMSPNAQLAIGYKFNPYIGMRGAINGWQSRGAYQASAVDLGALGTVPAFNDGKNNYYHWAYLAGTVDAVVDLTNLIGGYNPTRLVEVDLIAGLGVNGMWHNQRAIKLNSALQEFYGTPDVNYLENIWDHSHAAFLGQFGLGLNFNCSDRFQVGLELMANTLTDKYNSKRAANTDWYFNCLVGIGYAFGPKYETVTRVIEPVVAEPQIVERIVERVVEVPAPAPAPVVQPMRRDIFFLINQYVIRPQEMEKVAQVAQYMQEHPNSHVTITGYADKGTGTLAINLRLSAQRSEAVAKALQNNYGISPSRMTVKSMGEDEYQPFPDQVAQNRVAIVIAE